MTPLVFVISDMTFFLIKFLTNFVNYDKIIDI